jgi:NAD(P)-dependent dehydrogenase (short-subunit alcohol dehydrogenase family)
MARVFITGPSDGIGLVTGRLPAEQGHAVVLHARSVVLTGHKMPAWLPARRSTPRCHGSSGYF